MRVNKSGNFILRGQTTEVDSPVRVHLFDGTYKSGFRIVDFKVAAAETNATSETQGKITTEPVDNDANEWNWRDTREVAWTATNMFSDGAREPPYIAIDTSVIIVEDIYIYVHNNTSGFFGVNYLIELEPVDLKAYEYAMSFIQNQSQGVG